MQSSRVRQLTEKQQANTVLASEAPVDWPIVFLHPLDFAFECLLSRLNTAKAMLWIIAVRPVQLAFGTKREAHEKCVLVTNMAI